MYKSDAEKIEFDGTVIGYKFNCNLPECRVLVVICKSCYRCQRYCSKEHSTIAYNAQLEKYRATVGVDDNRRSSRRNRQKVADAKAKAREMGPEAVATERKERAERAAKWAKDRAATRAAKQATLMLQDAAGAHSQAKDRAATQAPEQARLMLQDAAGAHSQAKDRAATQAPEQARLMLQDAAGVHSGAKDRAATQAPEQARLMLQDAAGAHSQAEDRAATQARLMLQDAAGAHSQAEDPAATQARLMLQDAASAHSRKPDLLPHCWVCGRQVDMLIDAPSRPRPQRPHVRAGPAQA